MEVFLIFVYGVRNSRYLVALLAIPYSAFIPHLSATPEFSKKKEIKGRLAYLRISKTISFALLDDANLQKINSTLIAHPAV